MSSGHTKLASTPWNLLILFINFFLYRFRWKHWYCKVFHWWYRIRWRRERLLLFQFWLIVRWFAGILPSSRINFFVIRECRFVSQRCLMFVCKVKHLIEHSSELQLTSILPVYAFVNFMFVILKYIMLSLLNILVCLL